MSENTTCTSPRQIEASRRNGAKSKGPKTKLGKAVSSTNALVPGLRSRNVLSFGEDPEEFAALVTELYHSLQPVGQLESCLVERIASLAWRLRRVERIETGMFEAEHVKVAAKFNRAMRRQVPSRLRRLTDEQLHKAEALLREYQAIMVEAQVDPFPAPIVSDARSTVPFAEVGKGVPPKSGWAFFKAPPDNARGKVPVLDLDKLSKKMPIALS